MKHSIKNIFDNLFIHMVFILLFSFLSLLMILDMNASFEKSDSLLSQKNSISSLTKLQTTDINIAHIQFNSVSSQLLNNIEKLQNIQKYNYINKLILNNTSDYTNDLNKLNELTKEFNTNASNYLFNDSQTDEIQVLQNNIKNSYSLLNQHIDTMLIKEILYSKEKFPIFATNIGFIFVLILIYIIVNRAKLNNIYKDIFFLYSVEGNKKEYTMFSQEMDAIALRMKRKVTTTKQDNTMIDKVTNLYNHEGLLYAYKNKASMKESNPISLTLFEIDDFSDNDKKFSADIVQTILKKIAFTFSLYEQAGDIFARTNYNQFTIILARSDKKELFKEMELIQKNINDLKFNVPDMGIISVTLSGGFTIKSSKMKLDSAIAMSKKALLSAKQHGGNKIYQEKDVKMMESI